MRTFIPVLSAAAAVLLVASCEAPAPQPPPTTSGPTASEGLDHATLSAHLLQRLSLEPGERVLLVASPGRFDPVVEGVREGIGEAGAVDLGVWAVDGAAPDSWTTDFTERLSTAEEDELLPALRDVDAAIMMPGAVPEHPVYGGLQDVLREGRGRTIHFHWAGAYALDGTLLETDPSIDAFYQDVLAHTDYDALAEAQKRFEDDMRGSLVRVTTPAGTDISFRIGDRPVTRQDGDASGLRAASARNLIDREVELPAGAIRVAPLEESVNGQIAFPPSVWSGEPVEGLVLSFESGRVIEAHATRGLQAALAEMEAAGPAGQAFREFALGFNPLLAIPAEGEPWIPYYGYGAGVARLSLGDNTELGGAVGGGYVRWNFFTDATVEVDGEAWVEGGRLIR
jgi:leucyl aminopeptidase (aminopeptidase T)